jgi:protein required for attachment to host cells
LPQGVALADTVANREEEHCQAWYRMQGRSFSIRRTTSVLAGHLVQILSEAAREGAYDGLVVIAAPEIARELDRALTPETRARLIGEIVRDLPPVVSVERMAQAELQH